MKCKDHPKYKGLRKPRVLCERCWQIFLGMTDACLNSGCQCSDECSDDCETIWGPRNN